MLSVFPEILFLSPFSALLIRVALAALFAYAAWRHLARPEGISRAFGVFEMVLASALFAGMWTQVAALFAGFLIIADISSTRPKLYSTATLLLALIMCVSLLVTGAGPLSLDLPL